MERPDPIGKFSAILQEKFKEALQAKTGWGRNEIMQTYDQATTAAFMDIMRQSLAKQVSDL